ncbi:MAG TPA: RidA family protein [Trueperaceae bacterium]|nr:RidA family protein [Trueperaceae bacterium]
MERMRVSSGSPYEETIGFSRAVRIGERVLVSGTAPVGEDGSVVAPGDAYGQARRCLAIIERALDDVGSALGEVVRTRVYLSDRRAWEGVARAHAEAFELVRPASSFVVVAGLLDAGWLVEIEAEAVTAGAPRGAPAGGDPRRAVGP